MFGTAIFVSSAAWFIRPHTPPVLDLGTVLALHSPGSVTAPRNEIWILFRLGDCHLTSAPFDTLNVIASQPNTRVVGVMLDPPLDSVDAERAIVAFHARFPVVLDRDSTFRRTLRRAGLHDPLYAVTHNGDVVATVNSGAGGTLSHLVGLATE